jgi:two-component system cell cycle sensor histidine kinase PleC
MKVHMREPHIKPARTGGAAQGSVYALVALLLAAFGFALVLEIDSQRRQSESSASLAAANDARIVAEQVNGALVHAWGALAGAVEVGRTQGLLTTDPRAIAAAAARARPVAGAAIVSSDGLVIASTNSALLRAATEAARAGRGQPTWAGAVRDGETIRPVLVRALGGASVVSVLDETKLMPDGETSARTFLTDNEYRILTSRPDDKAVRGVGFGELFGVAPEPARSRFLARAPDGATVAVGAASTSVGELHVFSVGPTPKLQDMLVNGLLQFMLMAIAPVLAVAALLILLRKNSQRARDAEIEVERVEQKFRLAADGAKFGQFEWRIEHDTIALSEQLQGLLRAPSDTISMAQFMTLAPAEDRGAIENAFLRARESGALDVSLRIMGAHRVSWVEMRGLALEDPAGFEGRRIVGTAIDVTARREAELRAGALQRRLRDAIDSFSGPFALYDSRKRLLLWNKSFQSTFALEANILRAGASYEAIAIACAKQIKRERVAADDSQTREVELSSGEWLQIQERRTVEGGVVSVGIDISAIKHQEAVLTQSEATLKAAVAKLEHSEARNRELARSNEEQKRRAEAASRAKSAFLANMSHELRTPLNAVIGFSEIMSQQLFGPLGDERYQTYSKDILASGQLLLDLINDILDMAKIEAGKFNLAPRPLDPSDAIEQAVRLMRRRAEEKGLQLLVDAPDLPEIEADHRAVKQMLLNLLSNAVKFTDKGGVMVEGRANETVITLRVIDTGRGISREHLPRLARPFEQVESELARDHPGTGLGLALTKSLAEMHGGRMEIESELGKGTVVTITLPRTAQTVEQIAAE